MSTPKIPHLTREKVCCKNGKSSGKKTPKSTYNGPGGSSCASRLVGVFTKKEAVDPHHVVGPNTTTIHGVLEINTFITGNIFEDTIIDIRGALHFVTLSKTSDEGETSTKLLHTTAGHPCDEEVIKEVPDKDGRPKMGDSGSTDEKGYAYAMGRSKENTASVIGKKTVFDDTEEKHLDPLGAKESATRGTLANNVDHDEA